MRLTSALLLLCGILISFTQAQITKYAAELPACGLQCILAAIEESPCSVTNSTCICTNPELLAYSTACVASTCNVTDSLLVAKIDELGCDRPVKNYTNLIRINAYITCITAEVIVVLRLWIKLFIAKSITPDDWVIFVAALFNVPFLGLSIIFLNLGFGRNIWDIPTKNISTILKLYVIDETVYLAILALTKISLLLFLQRIFPSRRFQIAVWIIGVFVAVFGVMIILISIFQCVPVSYAWEKWDGVAVGKCNNVNVQTYASAAINILQDFAILFLPLPELYKLQVSTRKKVQLFLMFSTGLFVSIVSIVRLQSLVHFANTTNPTSDFTPATYWTAIETEVGLICACMPAIRHLLGHLFPNAFKSIGKENSTPKSNPRSFKLDKKSRSDHHDFHELDERTNVCEEDSSPSEHDKYHLPRAHAATPDSQQKIIDDDSKIQVEANVWAVNDLHKPQPNFLEEQQPEHKSNNPLDAHDWSR